MRFSDEVRTRHANHERRLNELEEFLNKYDERFKRRCTLPQTRPKRRLGPTACFIHCANGGFAAGMTSKPTMRRSIEAIGSASSSQTSWADSSLRCRFSEGVATKVCWTCRRERLRRLADARSRDREGRRDGERAYRRVLWRQAYRPARAEGE